jgi:hypothetical protein
VCPAAIYTALAEDGPEEPVCLDCADGEPCVAERCAGRTRESSGVSPSQDVYGEIVFAKDLAPVVTRTAEELGIARAVKDVPAETLLPYAVRPDWQDKLPRRTVKMDRPVKRPSVISGQLSATKKAGASVSASASAKGEETEMPNWNRVTDERKALILAGAELTAKACAEKYGISPVTVAKIRHAGGQGRSARPYAKRTKAAAKKPETQLAEVDPGRKGSAASLLTALQKIDADRSRVHLSMEMTQAEIAGVLARLSEPQRQTFMSAGMKAVLLNG